MKDKVIETAGKTWKYLGQNQQASVSKLPKLIKEKDSVVYQALGWLAREDKVAYSAKGRQVFVSLVEGEKNAFDQWAQENGFSEDESNAKNTASRNRIRKLYSKNIKHN